MSGVRARGVAAAEGGRKWEEEGGQKERSEEGSGGKGRGSAVGP